MKANERLLLFVLVPERVRKVTTLEGTRHPHVDLRQRVRGAVTEIPIGWKRRIVVFLEVLFGALPASSLPLPVFFGLLPGMTVATVLSEAPINDRLFAFWGSRFVALYGLASAIGAAGLWLHIVHEVRPRPLSGWLRRYLLFSLLLSALIAAWSLRGLLGSNAAHEVSLGSLVFACLWFTGPLALSLYALFMHLFWLTGTTRNGG